MKIKLLLVVTILLLTGCSTQEPETTVEANPLEVDSVQKLLSASDVHVTDEYSFAYSNKVVDGIDTYKSGNPITFTSDEEVEFMLISKNEDGSSIDIDEIVLDESNNYTFQYNNKDNHSSFRISASEEIDIVISTM